MENETIPDKNGEIFQIEKIDFVNATKRLDENKGTLNLLGNVDVTVFKTENDSLLDANYENIEAKQKEFQTAIRQREENEKAEKSRIERLTAAARHRASRSGTFCVPHSCFSSEDPCRSGSSRPRGSAA